MPDEGSQEKSLEMRVAELEDKLSKIHITEDEMKAYHKVSALLRGGGAAGGASMTEGVGGAVGGTVAGGCVVDCSGCINECTIRACTIARQCTVLRQCTIIHCIIRQCTIIRACTAECFECGPGLPGNVIGGQFDQLGG